MSKYCRNCGKEINDEKVCPHCKTEVIDTKIDVEKKKEELQIIKKEEKKALSIFCSLFIGSFILAILSDYVKFLGSVAPILFIASIIYLIYKRVTFPKSNLIKLVLDIVILLILIYYISLILITIACTKACYSIV